MASQSLNRSDGWARNPRLKVAGRFPVSSEVHTKRTAVQFACDASVDTNHLRPSLRHVGAGFRLSRTSSLRSRLRSVAACLTQRDWAPGTTNDVYNASHYSRDHSYSREKPDEREEANPTLIETTVRRDDDCDCRMSEHQNLNEQLPSYEAEDGNNEAKRYAFADLTDSWLHY